MSYIKHSKGRTEEKKIVNARVSSKTIEAINNKRIKQLKVTLKK